MNNIWFSSDHHWSDNNALKYRYRPFENIEEMNIKMVELWNKYVQPEDTVYYLGDFAVNDEDIEKYKSLLNGNFILVVGNHDYKRDRKILEKCFNEIHDEPFILTLDKELDVHNEGNELWIAHYPLQRHEKLYSVVGHIHNLWQIAKGMINIGVDAWNFRPVSLNQVLDSRHSELVGHWDANVYPDASLDWRLDVSSKIKRDNSGGEPTSRILEEEYYPTLIYKQTLLDEIKELSAFLAQEDRENRYSPCESLSCSFSNILDLWDKLEEEIAFLEKRK